MHLREIAPNIPKYKSEICKLKIYERNGFVLGYNLIATFGGYTNEKGEKEVFDPYKAESIVRELTY